MSLTASFRGKRDHVPARRQPVKQRWEREVATEKKEQTYTLEKYRTTAQLRQSDFMQGLLRNGLIVVPKRVQR